MCQKVNKSRGGGVLIGIVRSISFSLIDTSHVTYLIPVIDLVIYKCNTGSFPFLIAVV